MQLPLVRMGQKILRKIDKIATFMYSEKSLQSYIHSIKCYISLCILIPTEWYLLYIYTHIYIYSYLCVCSVDRLVSKCSRMPMK